MLTIWYHRGSFSATTIEDHSWSTKQYKAKHPALGSMILHDLVDPSPTTAWQTMKAVRYGARCVASGIASLKANHGRNVGKGG